MENIFLNLMVDRQDTLKSHTLTQKQSIFEESEEKEEAKAVFKEISVTANIYQTPDSGNTMNPTKIKTK